MDFCTGKSERFMVLVSRSGHQTNIMLTRQAILMCLVDIILDYWTVCLIRTANIQSYQHRMDVFDFWIKPFFKRMGIARNYGTSLIHASLHNNVLPPKFADKKPIFIFLLVMHCFLGLFYPKFPAISILSYSSLDYPLTGFVYVFYSIKRWMKSIYILLSKCCA